MLLDCQIRDAPVHLLDPEPDGPLVQFVRWRVPGLNPAEVRASQRRLRTTFGFPLVEASAVAPSARSVESKATSSRRTPPAQSADGGPGAGKPWRHVTLADLIEAGLVGLPLGIEHRYRGTLLRARIEWPERIMFEGQPFDSLSTAGGLP